MKLDRNVGNGTGKYAVVKLRRMGGAPAEVQAALATLLAGGFVTMDSPGGADEFFVVMLKDAYAPAALYAYATAADQDGDPDYANDVRELAARSGSSHPDCKRPD